MKILLVSPLGKDTTLMNWATPALGIRRLAAYLQQYRPQDEVMVYDNQIHKEDPLYAGQQIDLLGVSVLHDTLPESLLFLRKWKELHPESLLVAGGPEATENAQDLLDHSPVDILVMAEGEDPLTGILEWKEGRRPLHEIDGIVFRRYAKAPVAEDLWRYWDPVDFRQFEYPAYWKHMQRYYDDPHLEYIPAVRIVSSTHCVRPCTYCSVSQVRKFACGEQVKPAVLTGEQIFTLVQRIVDQVPQARRVYFCSDDCLFYKEPFLDFLHRFKAAHIPLKMMIQTHSRNLTEDLFPLLAECGCDQISIGIENASPFLRESLGKTQSSEHIERIVQWSKHYGVPVYFLIMLFPPETRWEDLWMNYEILSRWIKQGVQISIEPVVYAYRGAPLWLDEDKYRFHYTRIPLGKHDYLKDPLWIEPRHPDIAQFVHKFLERAPAYIEEKQKYLPHRHLYKGARGPIYVQLLGDMLKEHPREHPAVHADGGKHKGVIEHGPDL